MPIDAPKPIAALAQEILRQQMDRNPSQFEQPVPTTPAYKPQVMSPGMLHTLGGLADAASTYLFMKRGAGEETNPLVRGVAGGSPELTGAVALGGLGITKALAHMLRKKAPKLADAMSANLGAEQLALSVANTNGYRDGQPSAFDQYRGAMQRSVINRK